MATILVVDDSAVARTMITDILAAEGHDAVPTADGEEALAMLAAGEFDAMFTDFNMPGMMGDELIARIRREKPDIPIVLVTSYFNTPAFAEADLSPVSRVVHKPFKNEDLLDALREIL
jgi:CheY-like chemotaxis protein